MQGVDLISVLRGMGFQVLQGIELRILHVCFLEQLIEDLDILVGYRKRYHPSSEEARANEILPTRDLERWQAWCRASRDALVKDLGLDPSLFRAPTPPMGAPRRSPPAQGQPASPTSSPAATPEAPPQASPHPFRKAHKCYQGAPQVESHASRLLNAKEPPQEVPPVVAAVSDLLSTPDAPDPLEEIMLGIFAFLVKSRANQRGEDIDVGHEINGWLQLVRSNVAPMLRDLDRSAS